MVCYVIFFNIEHGDVMDLFSKNSVAHGIDYGEFAKLSNSSKKKLIALMARISEKSYRRGFQHGKEITRPVVDPAYFRFEIPIDKSPYTDEFSQAGTWLSNSGSSAIERLEMEYPELSEIGFYSNT